jgi:zinc protease
VRSPGGIEIWLVREAAVPLITMEFAFLGGTGQDPAGKGGVANMVAQLLDEGAGDLDAKAFQLKLEERAIELSFRTGKDYFHGTLRTLAEHREHAFDLLRLALNAPRFDPEPVERVRAQVLSGLRRDTTSPNSLASRRWWEAAFPDHPYGRPVGGTLESVPNIAIDDLKSYPRRVFAREHLKIAVVGNVDAQTVGALVDRVFAPLPAKPELQPVAPASPRGLGRRVVIPLDVPQTVVTFGGSGIHRREPDFMAAYVVNHILGGGSFSSRLYREIREQRGLAYSVHESLVWLRNAAIFVGGTATRADRTGEALEIIEKEIGRFAAEGPTEEELAKAKAYLKGSYALNLDTSSKIASQLVQIQIDELGIDYISRRNALIDAVTLADARRVAKRLLGGGLLVTVVGRPQGVTAKEAD